ncbi:MAG: hypothetical protein CML68_07400 [Rhodobacteraceae bacterium]|nr:hypothetical protein [Paracoccaceae bacterium]
MRRLTLATALALVSATAAPAVEWPWAKPTIYSLTKAMNCQSWRLDSPSERAPIYGALPNWLIFNEGPSPVAIRGPGSRSRDVLPFDGTLETVLGEPEVNYKVTTNNTGGNDVINARGILGANYTVGLSAGGSATVHVCRV